MNPCDLRQALEQLRDRLCAHPSVENVEFDISEGYTGTPALDVPHSVLECYRAVDGFSFSWRLKPDVADGLMGTAGYAVKSKFEVRFPGLDEVIEGRGLPSASDEAAALGFIAFDSHGYETHVGLLFEEGSVSDATHRYDAGDESLYPVGGTVADYVQACIQSLGVGSWRNCWGSASRPDFADYDFFHVAQYLFDGKAYFTAFEIDP